MNKLLKSSLVLTSVGLFGSVVASIRFIMIANQCRPDSVGVDFIKCQYAMIGVAIWREYLFLPIIAISFVLVLIPALIFLSKKKKPIKFHVGLIIYSIVAFIIAYYLGHILIRLFF
ncbi:MAG: hypothetical protein RL536_5 [Candidatus Parcubacteria bacterium]